MFLLLYFKVFFLVAFNSFVHTVMYGYYALSALGPHIQPYLWWKKYLTQLQLVQFVCAMIHSVVNYLQTDCPFPKAHSIGFLSYSFVILLLFADFYVKSYTKNPRKGASTKKAD